jgi:hypothetical protein
MVTVSDIGTCSLAVGGTSRRAITPSIGGRSGGRGNTLVVNGPRFPGPSILSLSQNGMRMRGDQPHLPLPTDFISARTDDGRLLKVEVLP